MPGLPVVLVLAEAESPATQDSETFRLVQAAPGRKPKPTDSIQELARELYQSRSPVSSELGPPGPYQHLGLSDRCLSRLISRPSGAGQPVPARPTWLGQPQETPACSGSFGQHLRDPESGQRTLSLRYLP